MRIIFILHQFYPEFRGGTERVALALAKSAQRAGHSVHVLACAVNTPSVQGCPAPDLRGALRCVHDGVPATLLPRTLLPATTDFSFETDRTLTATLTDWMQRRRFDIAHVLHPMRMASALLAAQRCGLPYVLTLTDFFFMCSQINLTTVGNRFCSGPQEGRQCAEHCLRPPWTSASLAGRHRQATGLLAAAGARVCPSDFVARRFREAFSDLSFSVIPHGIDMHQLPAGNPAHEKTRGVVLGVIGTIVPQKGLLPLLRALSTVPDPGLKLRVVGGFHGDPAYHAQIRAAAASDPRVELLGELPPAQIGAFLHTIDLLCLPSLVPESFSLVLNEAAAAGVPALVSDLGAPPERVTPDCGLALPAGDSAAWGKALRELTRDTQRIAHWRANLPLPLSVEEEAFFYESWYRRLTFSGPAN